MKICARVHLRPTRDDDLDFVCAAETHPENSPHVGSWHRLVHQAALAATDRDHWIIEHAGAPVGFVIVLDLQAVGRGVHIKRMVVTEKNRGFGRAALAEGCRRAFSERGAPFVWLDVLADNARAQAAYRAAGFTARAMPRAEAAEWAAAVGGFDEPSVLMFLDAPPKLYGELASWWPLLSAPADYAEEARLYRAALRSGCTAPPRSVLELGCGGGNNASHLKAHFELTLTDASEAMLDVSRALNPQCAHVSGDMRTLRLGRDFDAVFVHDAVAYLATEADLRRAMETAYVHCRPGGCALFAPDHLRETFRASADHGGHDGGRRSLRYLEWTWDPDPTDTSIVADYAFLLREGDDVRVVHDRHLRGLFARADWLRLLAETGFRPEVHPFLHSETADMELFLARRPTP